MALPIRRQTPTSVPAHLRADHPAASSWLRSHAPNITLGLLRIVAGLMFVQLGAQKIFGVLPMQGMPPWTGMPAQSSLTRGKNKSAAGKLNGSPSAMTTDFFESASFRESGQPKSVGPSGVMSGVR